MKFLLRLVFLLFVAAGALATWHALARHGLTTQILFMGFYCLVLAAIATFLGYWSEEYRKVKTGK